MEAERLMCFFPSFPFSMPRRVTHSSHFFKVVLNLDVFLQSSSQASVQTCLAPRLAVMWKLSMWALTSTASDKSMNPQTPRQATRPLSSTRLALSVSRACVCVQEQHQCSSCWLQRTGSLTATQNTHHTRGC